MADKFNKGDVVVLKSGGVPMTVDTCPGEHGATGYKLTEYRCVWQKGATHMQHSYPEHVLQTFAPPLKNDTRRSCQLDGRTI